MLLELEEMGVVKNPPIEKHHTYSSSIDSQLFINSGMNSKSILFCSVCNSSIGYFFYCFLR